LCCFCGISVPAAADNVAPAAGGFQTCVELPHDGVGGTDADKLLCAGRKVARRKSAVGKTI